MTELIRNLTVVLDKDYREGDDCEWIINAIRMIRGVIKVGYNVIGGDDYINREVIKSELKTKLLELLK